MKLPREQEREIIEGMLPLLLDVMENTERVTKVEGRSLIYQGITETKTGEKIQPGKKYVYREPTQVPVNHRRRIRHIIENATSLEAMENDLAAYIVKFGTSKEDLKASISRIDPHVNN